MKKIFLFLVMAITFAGVSVQTVEHVDLGLSVKWADRNVGADSSTDYGGYYQWGATTTYEEGSSLSFDIGGMKSYDAATANYGEGWRLPTKTEMEELVNKCTWIWTTINECNGYIVIGPNGNRIFLPAAGRRGLHENKRLRPTFEGGCGYYWSSTPTLSGGAYDLEFDMGDTGVFKNYNTCRSIRAVYDK